MTGGDYYDHVREHVCRPAGMARAEHLHLDHVADFAHGYTTIEWEGPPHPDVRTDNIFQYPVRGSAATGLYSAIGHGGRALGAATFLLFLRELDISVCVLSNLDRPADKRVFTEIDRLLTSPG